MSNVNSILISEHVVNAAHLPTPTFQAAQEYRELSWGVIPFTPHKRPALASWKEYQSRHATDDEIRSWFGPHQIGIVTGSISGLVVIDCDTPEAISSIEALLPDGLETPIALTPRGRHYYFTVKTIHQKNRTGVIPGVDVRGEGGCVVAPPGPGREWLVDPNDCPLAEMPSALRSLLENREDHGEAVRIGKTSENSTQHGASALYDELQQLANAPQGQRNDRLNMASYRLGQLTAAGLLSQTEAETGLLDTAQKLGLPQNEARKTITSGLNAGQLQHRSYKASEPVEPDWPDPVPFDDFSAPALPVDCLPSWAAEFTKAAAEQVQVATCMSMANVLGAFATASARKFVVELKPDLREPVNLYLLSTGLPGERKTQIQGVCFRPLWDWETSKQSEMALDIKRAQCTRKNHDARLSGLRSKLTKSKASERGALLDEIEELELSTPEVPTTPRLIADDITPEALAVCLAQNDERLGIATSEGGWFETLAGRYSGGVPNLDLVLKSHAAEPVRIDRKNGQPVRLNSPTLTLCLCTQPDVLLGLASKTGFRPRGLLGRFLYVIPQSLVGRRNYDSLTIPGNIKRSYEDAVNALLDMPWAGRDQNGAPEPYVLRLSPGAYQAWNAFCKSLEPSLGPGGQLEAISDWAGKLTGLVGRLAGNIHLMEHLDKAPEVIISMESMDNAIALAGVLIEHAKVAFGMMGADPELEDAKACLGYIKRERCEQFSLRDVHRAVQGRLPRAHQVKKALATLQEHGYLLPEDTAETNRPGRPASPRYLVNPKLLKAA